MASWNLQLVRTYEYDGSCEDLVSLGEDIVSEWFDLFVTYAAMNIRPESTSQCNGPISISDEARNQIFDTMVPLQDDVHASDAVDSAWADAVMVIDGINYEDINGRAQSPGAWRDSRAGVAVISKYGDNIDTLVHEAGHLCGARHYHHEEYGIIWNTASIMKSGSGDNCGFGSTPEGTPREIKRSDCTFDVVKGHVYDINGI